MNPNNPNFRTIEEWADKCDMLGQELIKKSKEIKLLKAYCEDLKLYTKHSDQCYWIEPQDRMECKCGLDRIKHKWDKIK